MNRARRADQAAHRPHRHQERHRPAARRHPRRDHPPDGRGGQRGKREPHRPRRSRRSSGSSRRWACWSSASSPTVPTTWRASSPPAAVDDGKSAEELRQLGRRGAGPGRPRGRVQRRDQRHQGEGPLRVGRTRAGIPEPTRAEERERGQPGGSGPRRPAPAAGKTFLAPRRAATWRPPTPPAACDGPLQPRVRERASELGKEAAEIRRGSSENTGKSDEEVGKATSTRRSTSTSC